MSQKEPLARYKRFGFSMTVYPNRIEVKRLAFLWLSRTTVIPLKSVANVEKNTATNRLTVHTNDGKRHKFVTGFQTGKLYEAILGAL